MSEPTGSEANWAGNGFYGKLSSSLNRGTVSKILHLAAIKKTLATTAEGARMADAVTGRTWTIVNEDKKHYSTKQPIGYKVFFEVRCQFCALLTARRPPDHVQGHPSSPRSSRLARRPSGHFCQEKHLGHSLR